jgi:hypothetical protein
MFAEFAGRRRAAIRGRPERGAAKSPADCPLAAGAL